MLMEIGVDGHGHVMTDTHHGTEGIGTQTHVGVLTHRLKRLSLLLHGVVVATESVDLDGLCLDLRRLSGSRRLDEFTRSTDAGTGSDLFQYLFTHLSRIDHHLYVLDGRTVVQGDKVNGLRATVRAHPALHADVLTVFRALQHIDNFSSFHFISYF